MKRKLLLSNVYASPTPNLPCARCTTRSSQLRHAHSTAHTPLLHPVHLSLHSPPARSCAAPLSRTPAPPLTLLQPVLSRRVEAMFEARYGCHPVVSGEPNWLVELKKLLGDTMKPFVKLGGPWDM